MIVTDMKEAKARIEAQVKFEQAELRELKISIFDKGIAFGFVLGISTAAVAHAFMN
jgi:hypothetical protein